MEGRKKRGELGRVEYVRIGFISTESAHNGTSGKGIDEIC